jgi:HPt (histidine-containing phosphotransfer) domain-containing protein
VKLTMSPTARIRTDLANVDPESRPSAVGSAGPAHAGLTDSHDPAEPPLDFLALHAQFDGDSAFVRRLCQTFVSSTSRILNELGAAALAGERTAVQALAHKIKGAGHNVHAHPMATLAATIESGAVSLPLPELTRSIDALRRAFDELLAHVSSELR